MTTVTHAVSAALLHFLWQGLLIALLAWFALALLRNGSARVRYFVSCAALGVMTILPVVTAWAVDQAPVAGAASNAVADIAQSADSAASSTVASFTAWIVAFEAWALPVWLAGVSVFAVRLIWISNHVAKLQRSGEVAEETLTNTVAALARRMKITGPVGVMISHLTDTPSVVGWLRPVILVPAATLLALSVEQLEAVLAHELAHVRRNDYLVNFLQALSETLLFYHPAIWWISARIRQERELCCDDLGVAVCGNAIGYARALATLERLRTTATELALSSAGGSLLYRIERLIGAPHDQGPSKVPALAALFLSFACVAIYPHWASGQPQPSRDAVISPNDVWIDTVKFGNLEVDVRALGTMVSSTMAELKVPTIQAGLVQVGQPSSIGTRPGIIIAGSVTHIDSPVSGTAAVAIGLQAPFPDLIGLDVDGTIRIRSLKDVVYVGRPISGRPDSSSTLFKLEPDGSHATRVTVRFGASSVNSIQVLEGLQPGDRVILSDMRKYDGYERVRLE